MLLVITMDIKKLKALAESIHIKDWVLDSRLYRITTQHAELIAEAMQLRFAEYIAAVSPARMLQLIATLDSPTTVWVITQTPYQQSPIYFCGFDKQRWELWTADSLKAVHFANAESAAAVMTGVWVDELRIKEITVEAV